LSHAFPFPHYQLTEATAARTMPSVQKNATRPECIAEFLGTFLLVLTVGCNIINQTAPWHGVSIASVLMVSIYSFGKISGANFNPAVSLSLAVVQALGGSGGISWVKMATYMGVQVLGGLAAALCYCTLFWDTATIVPPTDHIGFKCLCEMLYTAMLCYVVLNVAAYQKDAKKGNEYYGLAIGYVIVAGAYGAGAVSGGAFNPAVIISVQATSGMRLATSATLILVYVLSQFAGALLAAGLYRAERPGEFGPEPVGRQKHIAALDAECVGTFYLVLTVILAVHANTPAAGFAIAASLMCMIYASGDISGAHFNPAVTLSVWLHKCANPPPDFRPMNESILALVYMVLQFLGALMAAWICSYGFPGGISAETKMGWSEVMIAEMVFTFVLCFVVMSTAVSKKTEAKNFFGLAIGSCVTVGGYAIGKVSGGCLNPAVALGVVFSDFMGNGTFRAKRLFLLFVAQFLGAAFASVAMRITHADESPEPLKK